MFRKLYEMFAKRHVIIVVGKKDVTRTLELVNDAIPKHRDHRMVTGIWGDASKNEWSVNFVCTRREWQAIRANLKAESIKTKEKCQDAFGHDLWIEF